MEIANDDIQPLPVPLADDFPAGDDLRLLLDVRNMICNNVQAMGLPAMGVSIGVGGADASFRLGDRRLDVQISITDPTKE